jgi:hypothetical protein
MNSKREFYIEEYKKVEFAQEHMYAFKLKQVQSLIDSAVITNEMKTNFKISIERGELGGVLSNIGWIINSFSMGVPINELGVSDEDFVALCRVMSKNIRKENDQFESLFKWWYDETLLDRMSM